MLSALDTLFTRQSIRGFTAVIEFCTCRPGTFSDYCNATDDHRRRRMRRELVVR